MNLIDKYLGELVKPTISHKPAKQFTCDCGKKFKKNMGKYEKDATCPACGKKGLTEKTEPTPMECIECGKKFKKKLGPKTFEVKCPKCGSYDTEPA